jgi:hypothetical protein
MDVNLSAEPAGARPGSKPGFTTSDDIIPYDERPEKMVTRQTLYADRLINNYLIIYCPQNDNKCVGFAEAFANGRPSNEVMNEYAGRIAAAGCGWLAWLFLVGGAVLAASPYERPGSGSATGESQLDQIVLAHWQQRHIRPAQLCSDAVFIRRVYLDVTGTLPSGVEAEQFIFSRDPAKRRRLIDQLLARDEYADYLAMKWGDVLRIKAEFPIDLWPNAAQSYHRWIRDAIRTNEPCDGMVRELLTASGSNFEMPPVNFYRAMQARTPAGIAQTVALTFLGERAEYWPTNELAALAVFFANVGYKSTAEWKEEIVYFNPAATNPGALNGTACGAVLPDGQAVTLSPEEDPRMVFADWLIKDPQFARNLVNRAWFWLTGRGIVEEPDDFRADNPPANPELLAYLAGNFAASGYDFKALCRLILNSKTYQLAALPEDSSPVAAANFAAYPLRRLDAEVLIDAVDQITGTNESYSSAIPEPYTFVPDNLRSIALPDGSITSSFLEMFGRPARDTGLESERNNHITASQKLWLLNSSVMQRKLEASRMIQFETASNRPPAAIVRGIYLSILSRFPTATESATAEAYLQSGPAKRQATVDLAWALMNTAEFLYRH